MSAHASMNAECHTIWQEKACNFQVIRTKGAGTGGSGNLPPPFTPKYVNIFRVHANAFVVV